MKVLSPQSKKTTSYKFAMFRAIIENLYKVNGAMEITFNQLAESFAKLYWNLVIRNSYSQGNRTQIEKELLLFKEEHIIPDGLTFDSIPKALQVILIHTIERKVINKDVVGALYADMGESYTVSQKKIAN